MSTVQKTTKRKPGRPSGSKAEGVILAGAWQAFAKQGFHDCTVASILEFSGSSRTNFYRFFKNKEAIFERILGFSIGLLEKEMDRAFTDAKQLSTLEEQLGCISGKYVNSCFAAGDILPVLFQEQHTLPKHKVLREKLFKKLHKGIEKLFVAAGYPEPEPLLVQGIMSGVDRVVLMASLKRGSVEAKKEKAIEVVHQLYKPLLYYAQVN